jgi:PIN domain nuclease of toxin-antitoxin system
MNLLIDTHILIWYIAGNPNLKPGMTDLLEAVLPTNTIDRPTLAMP